MADHLVAPRHGGEEKALDPLVDQVVDEGDLSPCVVARVSNDRRIARRREGLRDAAENRREHRVGQIGEDHADKVGPAGAQARGHAVGLIAETARDLADPVGDVVGHQMALPGIERARDGRDVDAAGRRDLLEGRGRSPLHFGSIYSGEELPS
jgi:hypothetical protein